MGEFNYSTILYKAQALEEKNKGEGISYLKDFLATDPLFDCYNKMVDSYNNTLRLDNDSSFSYPLLERVLSYLDHDKDIVLLDDFLDLDISDEQRLIALRLRRKFTTDLHDRYELSREIFAMSGKTIDEFHVGEDAYNLGEYDEAFKALNNSMPYSLELLVNCYINGYGVEKNLTKAYIMVVTETKNNNDTALRLLKDLIKYHEEELNVSKDIKKLAEIEAFSLSEKEKNELLLEARKRKYMTKESLYSFFGKRNKYQLELAVEFLNRYGYKVYNELLIEREDTLVILDYLLNIFDKYGEDISYVPFIDRYDITPEMVKFYLDGYTHFYDEDDEEEPDGPFLHTPEEASAKFNIPLLESYLKLEKLKMFLADNNNRIRLLELIYEIEDELTSVTLEDDALDIIDDIIADSKWD